MHLGDRIITIDGCDVSSKKHIEIAALIQKGREKNQMNLLLWRHTKSIHFNIPFKNNKYSYFCISCMSFVNFGALYYQQIFFVSVGKFLVFISG